ncbi:Arabinanase/levansucrase/invertase [Desarmillaria tabescens]|uniref:Arabinanase/levansucrase/invertase n=1 Tax=Armillaria tabescens TaxID=1929756 RepID=A0AA39NQD6_ARMTA|nr:Arabinanase/levansucrase/invertase [Desarmillaria tabescens]KAK0469927.1 Arabinanase/levansucrase/invertase [Desarmillaria tabescens]
MLALFLLCIISFQVSSALGVATFTNPIKSSDGSDPFMVYHEGYYYLTTTTWSNIQITRATTISGLKTATPKVVWSDSTSSRCCNVWAPEIHWQPTEASWYIYYSAGSSGTLDNQHIHVLKGSSNIIWDSAWSYAGRIVIPNRDVWSIDATVLVYGDIRYLVFSSWDGNYQCLWIAQMTSATTVGSAVKISTPTLSWEQVGANVNEGPAALYHDGRTWIVFSASSCAGTAYSLGRLELTGTNPLSPSSWSKYSNPIFTSANGNNEPGHNGFFLSPSGNEIHMVYHASSTVPALCDGSRYTMVQQVTWHTDGTPNLGSPRALTDNVPEPQ